MFQSFLACNLIPECESLGEQHWRGTFCWGTQLCPLYQDWGLSHGRRLAGLTLGQSEASQDSWSSTYCVLKDSIKGTKKKRTASFCFHRLKYVLWSSQATAGGSSPMRWSLSLVYGWLSRSPWLCLWNVFLCRVVFASSKRKQWADIEWNDWMTSAKQMIRAKASLETVRLRTIVVLTRLPLAWETHKHGL